MTYRYDRHESSAAQQTDDELTSNLAHCRMMRRMYWRAYRHETDSAVISMAFDNWRWYNAQYNAIVSEISKRTAQEEYDEAQRKREIIDNGK